MGRSCSINGCRSNYDNAIKISSFGVPKDKILRDKWIKFINRPDLNIHDRTTVCIKHFESRFVIKEDLFPILDGDPILVPRKTPKLSTDAYPTIYPKQPYICKRKTKFKKQSKIPQKCVPEQSACDEQTYEVETKKSSSKKKQRVNVRRKRLNSKKKQVGKKCVVTDEAREDISLVHVPEIIPQQQTQSFAEDGNTGKTFEMDTENETEEILVEQEHSPSLCRLCASPSDNAISIFENKESNYTLLEKIHTYLPIMITAEDLLPTTICEKCIDRIEICHNLVQDCLDADAILKTMFGVQNTDQVEYCDEQFDTNITSCNSLEESSSCENYNYMNHTDIKFEVESIDVYTKEQTLNHIADENNYDNFQNSELVTLDSTMMKESAVHTQIENKQLNTMSKSRKRRRNQKSVLLKRKAVKNMTDKGKFKKILESTLRPKKTLKGSKNQTLKEKHKRRKRSSIDNYSITCHKEISKLKNMEEDLKHAQEKVAMDHTYTFRLVQ